MKIKEIVAIAIVMLALDAIYLGTNRSFFSDLFRNVQGSELKFNFKAAFFCYTLMVFGLYYFIIKDKKPILDAFLLGLLVYGVYDLTNLGTLTNWTVKMTVMDTLWGASLFALTTFIVYKIKEIM